MRKVYEICPYCDEEVKLRAEFKKQQCPRCKEYINPCALCDMDEVDCSNCPLDGYTPDDNKKVVKILIVAGILIFVILDIVLSIIVHILK